ncbi:MAG: glutamate synthase subunit beta [Phycisphaerae bacterium]|nr:glutamate synthase subunit beta [Phycisphaerae bacterium]
MADPTGFLKYARQDVGYRPVSERVQDSVEIEIPHPEETLVRQAARCMDCGIPFCHTGCPVKNRIPEFNELVYRGKWEQAAANLHSTNNFPEITGRVCPAPCEAACTLSINTDPVLIRHIEYQIAERAFAEGWVRPIMPARHTGKRVAIVGSGPAGLAAAQQLARAGHSVVVFEKDDRIGGLLRYGIPDFKLEKGVLDRRLEQMRQEGVVFEPGVLVGEDISARYLRNSFDAVLLAMGAGVPRPLSVPGHDCGNVHYAMDFLTRQNRIVAGDGIHPARGVSARGKVVVVLGGGDTGSDCVGTAIRQGAKEVHQFEILDRPPEGRNPATPWPTWPRILRTTSSHEEGCQRRWNVLTQRITGTDDRAEELHGVGVEWIGGPRGTRMQEVPGTEFSMKVDLVLLAMGFQHVVHSGLVDTLGLKLDSRGNICVRHCHTSEEGVFAAGDAVAGASLVVTAINAGREAAAAMHRYLMQSNWKH